MPIRPFLRPKKGKKLAHTCDPEPTMLIAVDPSCDSVDSDLELEQVEIFVEEPADEDCEDEPLLNCSFDHFVSELHPHKTEAPLVGGGKNKKKPKKKKKINKIMRDYSSAIVTPPHLYRELIFQDPLGNYAAASPFYVQSLRINDLYDPDPAILTSNYAGFAQQMTFYDFFRVHGVEVEWDVANNEPAVAVKVGMRFTNFYGEAAVLTYQGACDFIENNFSSGFVELQRSIGGPSVHHFKHSLNPGKVLADQLYYTDSQYVGTGSSSPLGEIFINFVVLSINTATNLTNGVQGSPKIKAYSKLFGQRHIEDTYSKVQSDKLLTLYEAHQICAPPQSTNRLVREMRKKQIQYEKEERQLHPMIIKRTSKIK